MKFQKTLKIALFFVGVVLYNGSRAQGLFSPQNVINQYTTVGFGGGSAHYFGELSPAGAFYRGLYTNVRFNLNANYTRYITPNAALRLQLSWVRLLGDDFTYNSKLVGSNRVLRPGAYWEYYIRNLHFRNDVKEVTVSGIFNLLPTYGKSGARGRRSFTPYLTVGLGLIAHDPKATLPVTPTQVAGEWESLRTYNTSGQGIINNPIKEYSLVQPVLPIGLGLRFKINDKIDITIEGNIRLTNTDYLDDVGPGPYFDPFALANSSGGGSRSSDLSYRAIEAVNSRFSGSIKANRLPALQSIYSDPDKLNAGPIVPSWLSKIEQLYGYGGTYSDIRGYDGRLKDAYATTQITISYVISNKIKCPVLK